MKTEAVKMNLGIKINVIQMKERQHPWVCARTIEVVSQIGIDEMLAEQTSGESARPFIKVTEDDARTLELRSVQYFLTDELPRLLPALQKSRTHVDVEYVEQGASG